MKPKELPKPPRLWLATWQLGYFNSRRSTLRTSSVSGKGAILREGKHLDERGINLLTHLSLAAKFLVKTSASIGQFNMLSPIAYMTLGKSLLSAPVPCQWKPRLHVSTVFVHIVSKLSEFYWGVYIQPLFISMNFSMFTKLCSHYSGLFF